MRLLVPLLLCLMALSASARASYTEWHFSGSDARVVVDREGGARVEQRLTVRVVAGSIRALSLSGYPAEAAFEPGGKVTTDDGRSFGLSVGRDGDTMLQATAQDALKKGDYVFELHYRVDLTQGHLSHDGALERLTFATPALPEGVDGVRMVFDLPAAPTEPRLAGEQAQGGVLSALRRSTDRDELELVRPHVPRGESVTWAVRIDPAALVRPVAAPPVARPPEAKGLEGSVILALVAGLAFAGLLALKRSAFHRACREAGATLAGAPSWLAWTAGGAAFGMAIHARLHGEPLTAGAFMAAATLASVIRARAGRVVRGPGTWVLLRPSDVFGKARTSRGKRVLVVVTLASCAAAVALTRSGSTYPDLPLLLLPPVLGVLVMGTREQLWPRAERTAAALRGVFGRLAADKQLKVSPLARLPAGRTDADEVRLLVVPRAPMPGLLGIEVATAWERRSGAFVPWARVLVRVHDDTAASAKMAGSASGPGRRPEERVFTFEPAWPTDRAAAALATELACSLVDRRVRGECIWAGKERRELECTIAPGLC